LAAVHFSGIPDSLDRRRVAPGTPCTHLAVIRRTFTSCRPTANS